MFRIKAGLVLGGVFLIIFGVRDAWLNSSASSTPVPVDLAALENGGKVENENVVIGPHVALFPYYVFETPSDSDYGDLPVNYCVYPIISISGGELERMAKHEGPDLPPLGNVAVLVKSKKYKRTSEIPESIEPRDSMQGLVINNINTLDNDMKDFIKKSYPNVNVDTVLVVEEGRSPNMILGALMAVGGIAMIGVGAALFLFVKSA